MAPIAPPATGFHLKGKLAVQEGSERYSASFAWQQAGERFDIGVWGPLGQGRVHLRGDATHVELLDGDGAVVRQGPPEQIMRAELGWTMPLEVLRHWVLGRPDQTLPVAQVERDDDGRYAAFSQAGWAVRFSGYREVVGGATPQTLPRRVDAERDATRVRLVVGSWQLGEEFVTAL